VIRLQNQRTRGIGVLLPKRFALFLVYWYPAHLADGTTKVESVRKERYFLPWVRNLYDSWEVFHGLDDELHDNERPIHLPHGGWHERDEGARAPRERDTRPVPVTAAAAASSSSSTVLGETA
jgi:hypothetical protein